MICGMHSLWEGNDLHIHRSVKSLLVLLAAECAFCTGCARSGQVSAVQEDALQGNTGPAVSVSAGPSASVRDVAELAGTDAVIPAEEDIRAFFAGYDAEESISEDGSNRFVEYGTSESPSFDGSLNYDNGGTRLRNAVFQVYGDIPQEDVEKFFTEAVFLFLPEGTAGTALQSFLTAALQPA